MAGLLADASAQAALAGAVSGGSGRLEEPDHSSANWYFGREEIEKRSPSRLDGIDMKKETYFRKSYCTFLQDLGMRLKVPQVTIATAIVFCHRFFHRQSHKKNDRHMIATICMFLAGKVEETPRPLREVIMFSYHIRFKKDPSAKERIKQKEIYEEQKELVLAGERLVLTTLGFDLNIHHPYKPLVAAIKKFKVAQNTLAQVAWNFVNDGLRTSLCLQFKPHHIAAGAIFLAAKFLKVNLPKDGDKVWWQEFEVTPRQLEEVSNQMLELYEQNKTNGATGSLANDPSPSEMNRLHAPATSTQGPSANGHLQQSPSGKLQAVELNADEASSQQVEEKASGTVPSLSPPSDRPLDAKHKEPSGGQILNGRIKQEITVKKEVLRPNENIVEENQSHQHERREGKSLERSDHADVERNNRVQRERSADRVEEGEVPSTSGTIRSPPRSADKRSLPDRSLSPGAQKRHCGSREQYGNRNDGHKDQRHSSHNRDHYHHHSSHHRFDQIPSRW